MLILLLAMLLIIGCSDSKDDRHSSRSPQSPETENVETASSSDAITSEPLIDADPLFGSEQQQNKEDREDAPEDLDGYAGYLVDPSLLFIQAKKGTTATVHGGAGAVASSQSSNVVDIPVKLWAAKSLDLPLENNRYLTVSDFERLTQQVDFRGDAEVNEDGSFQGDMVLRSDEVLIVTTNIFESNQFDVKSLDHEKTAVGVIFIKNYLGLWIADPESLFYADGETLTDTSSLVFGQFTRDTVNRTFRLVDGLSVFQSNLSLPSEAWQFEFHYRNLPTRAVPSSTIASFKIGKENFIFHFSAYPNLRFTLTFGEASITCGNVHANGFFRLVADSRGLACQTGQNWIKDSQVLETNRTSTKITLGDFLKKDLHINLLPFADYRAVWLTKSPDASIQDIESVRLPFWVDERAQTKAAVREPR